MYNSGIFKHRLPLKQEYCLQVHYFAKFYRIHTQTFAVSGAGWRWGLLSYIQISKKHGNNLLF